jgi:hypothetical protein
MQYHKKLDHPSTQKLFALWPPIPLSQQGPKKTSARSPVIIDTRGPGSVSGRICTRYLLDVGRLLVLRVTDSTAPFIIQWLDHVQLSVEKGTLHITYTTSTLLRPDHLTKLALIFPFFRT